MAQLMKFAGPLRFAGYAAIFDVPDRGGDVVRAGAFTGVAAAGVPLAGVCTGVFILARAGLMAGRDACVSWFHHDEFQAEFGAGSAAGAGPAAPRPVSDRTLVVDGDRLSCSGGVSAAQLAALLVDRHIGRAAARKALAIMMIDTPGGPGAPAFGDQPQPGMPLELSTADPLVRRALMILQQRLDSPPTVAALAAHLGVGRRRLERHFAAALGLSPAAAARRWPIRGSGHPRDPRWCRAAPRAARSRRRSGR